MRNSILFRHDPVLQCNGNCTCNKDIFEPVCGPYGKNYLNPCYAGCPRPSLPLVSNDTNTSMVRYVTLLLSNSYLSKIKLLKGGIPQLSNLV